MTTFDPTFIGYTVIGICIYLFLKYSDEANERYRGGAAWFGMTPPIASYFVVGEWAILGTVLYLGLVYSFDRVILKWMVGLKRSTK